MGDFFFVAVDWKLAEYGVRFVTPYYNLGSRLNEGCSLFSFFFSPPKTSKGGTLPLTDDVIMYCKPTTSAGPHLTERRREYHTSLMESSCVLLPSLHKSHNGSRPKRETVLLLEQPRSGQNSAWPELKVIGDTRGTRVWWLEFLFRVILE